MRAEFYWKIMAKSHKCEGFDKNSTILKKKLIIYFFCPKQVTPKNFKID